MSTRVFVRLYDGATQRETDDEVLELPPPPLKWTDAITAMVAAVGKQADPAPEAAVVVAAVNGSAVRPMTLSTPSASSTTSQPSISPYANGQITSSSGSVAPSGNMGGPPRGGLGAGAPSGSLMSSGKKGNKRYRSISGKMAAIKSLGDKGIISNDDRGHLKDLLLNSDSPQLQEALDKYNNTGDFQAVKDLLLKEMHNPSSKRNTGDWLSESFVNEIALNFNTTPPASKAELVPGQSINNTGRFNTAPAALNPSPSSYGFQTSSQSAPMNAAVSFPQSSPMAMNHYSASASLVTPTGANLSSSNNGYPASMPMPSGYQPTTVMQQQYPQPQVSPTNNMYGNAAPQINLPLRDRATYLKRGYESSPVHNMMGMNPPAVSPAASAQMGMTGYGMQQGYGMNQGSYPANVIYAGEHIQYAMNPYMSGANGVYNPYQQQQQYAMNRYAYGSMQPDMGYNYYAAGYGFGKAQLRAGPGGKWTTAPPMPSYPPPCSKEEKKEKIAKWLKKRENRNWSNKPSYPVRHSIAKNRKRGEDGRFITKARLAEMAAEEAAAAAAAGNSDEPQKASPPGSTTEEAPVTLVSETTMLQATPVP
ncbi:unnamed protein product [Phytophthora fragariaefolia]|uniref:Unnamed protein product n=1 Tax=Phytophthora fragariaefolia TaxID=1490495 RepID=A0A9W7DC04_9STRA|nr:unnamed protein product [Phytophthora fragariaefolia]